MRRFVAIAATVMLAVSFSACSSSSEKKIEFQVSGPAGADVAYQVGGSQEQENGATLPWKKEKTSTDDPLIAVLVAQSKGSGEIICKILVDGTEVKTAKSTGEFAVVTCSTDPN